MTPDLTSALETLANAIIPRDARDDGAAGVHAGAKLAAKIDSGVNTALYTRGLSVALALTQGLFSRSITALNADELQALLGRIKEQHPDFFRQLRADVCALYLSDPCVWARIGFPGPSIESGGYPDFDQEQ